MSIEFHLNGDKVAATEVRQRIDDFSQEIPELNRADVHFEAKIVITDPSSELKEPEAELHFQAIHRNSNYADIVEEEVVLGNALKSIVDGFNDMGKKSAQRKSKG